MAPAALQVISSEPVTTPWANVFGTDEEKRVRNKIRAERKIQFEGGDGVGPARVPKSYEEH